MQVRELESAEHAFRLVSARPALGLRGMVRGYQDFWERSSEPLRRRELASPDIVVIIDLGCGWRVDGLPHGSFAGGLFDGPVLVEHGGAARAVQVDLTPAGARALLGVPPVELTRRVVDLEELLGPGASRLADRLHAATTSEARFALLDTTLAARAAGAAGLRPDVAWALRRLAETSGRLRIGALAEELGCSRRHLSARFTEEVGLPPKAYARVLRFRRAADALLEGGEAGLSAIAADCGYADQPHLNREFAALAGVSPTRLLAQQMQAGAGHAA